MNVSGLLVGAVTFLLIGMFHIIVVKVEYYWTKRVWPFFLIAGCVCLAASLMVKSTAPSSMLAVLGFTFLWSIKELFEQEERVKRGWFPQNPNRDKSLKPK